MISWLRAKFLGVQVLILVGIVIAFSGLLVAAKVVYDSSTGADSASAYHQVQAVPADADQLVAWTKDAWTRPRQLEPATRTALSAAYVRAWAALGRYESTGDSAALEDTFSGPARQLALQTPRSGQVATWDTSHRLQLTFYALDGATAAFTDTDAELVRTIAETGGQETVVLSQENYDVVMVLEDGYWRVRQLRRLAQPVVQTVSSAAGGSIFVTGITPATASPLPDIRATEYRLASWTTAGVAAAAPDLTRLKALGLTTVRIPLPFSVFGEGTGRAQALAALPALLSAARQRGLTVEPVLLDGITDLAPGGWSAADHEVTAIVAAVGSAPALLAWDLLDDPDSHAGAATTTEVRAFLVQEAQLLRQAGAITRSTAPVTIGWPDVASATAPGVGSLVDIVTLAVPNGTPSEATLTAARGAAGAKSVMVVTPGPASDGGWSPFPRTEIRQAATLADELGALRGAGVRAFSVGALLDNGSDGRGLLRSDGSSKPAAALVAPGADLTAVPRPGITDLLSGKFYRIAGLVAAVLLLLLVRWWLTRHRPRRGRHRNPEEPPVWPPPGATPRA